MAKTNRSLGPRKRQVFKLSLSDFRDAEDARIAARFGTSGDYAGLGSLLSLFYEAKREPDSLEKELGLTADKKGRGLDALGARLGQMMMEALHARDASFFENLGKLISVPDAPTSPIDHALLSLFQSRDKAAREAFQQRLNEMEGTISEELMGFLRESVRCQCELAEMDFPTWPPTAPDLHEWLQVAGIECDEKSVRRVAKRHGIHLAPAKKGAPSKK
jgi:hypothetical protein